MTTPLLMISYEAPPRLSAESILAGKTLKALAEVNPEGPVIDLLCASPGDEVPVDAALETLFPETVRVHRIDPVPHGRKTILQRIIGGKGGWQKSAVSKALALFPAEHKKPVLLYSRSHPPASHLVAMELVQGPLKGVPWVAHFSDPWSQHGYYRSPVTRAALARLEHQVIHSATRLIFVSETLRDTVLGGASDEIKAKARVVPHLFDLSLYAKGHLPEPLAADRAAQLKIVAHVGDLYGMRSPQPLLNGLAQLQQAQSELPRLLFWLVGRFDPAFQGLDEQAGVAKLLHYHPSVAYLDSLAVVQAADVLLAVEAVVRNNVFFPSKLVDYLGARKPMFAITPKGSLTSRLMDHWKQPWCDNRDTPALVSVLKRIADGNLWAPPPQERQDCFASTVIGRQLARIFAEVLPPEAPPPPGLPQ